MLASGEKARPPFQTQAVKTESNGIKCSSSISHEALDPPSGGADPGGRRVIPWEFIVVGERAALGCAAALKSADEKERLIRW